MDHAHHDVIIRKLKVHSPLDDEGVTALRGLSGHARNLGPNEDFVRQGETPDVSALVMSGMVGRYHVLSGGKRQYLSFHLTGDMPDAQSLFIERMDHAVCAIGPASVVMIPHAEICGLLERHSPLAFAIWRETLIDAAIFRQAITNNGSRPMQTRLEHLLCELYFRSRVAGVAKPGSCYLPINQGQLGEALGMSIVTVNRTIQALRATRTMELRNGLLTVHDWNKLTELGDFDPSYLSLKKPSRL
jgi:CRP-like cAMP-binding protein